MLELLLITLASSPPSGSGSTELYVLGAFTAGGGLALAGNLVRHWRRGQIEDTELITRITKDTVAGAKDILAEYRVEVEIIKRQVEDYRRQLNQITMALAEANVRISKLESDLDNASIDRKRLLRDLEKAIEERHNLLLELERLRTEINILVAAREEGTPQ